MTNLPTMLVKGCRLVSCSKPYHLSLKYVSALSSHQRNKQPSTFKHGNIFGVEGSSLDTGTATCFGIPEQRHVHQMNNKHGSYAGVINSDKETRSRPTKSGSRLRYDSAVLSDVFGAPRLSTLSFAWTEGVVRSSLAVHRGGSAQRHQETEHLTEVYTGRITTFHTAVFKTHSIR